MHTHATYVKKLVVGCLLRARSLRNCKLQGRLRRELRGMDALHIACAVEWGAELFVSSDKAQLAAAKKAGLSVKTV